MSLARTQIVYSSYIPAAVHQWDVFDPELKHIQIQNKIQFKPTCDHLANCTPYHRCHVVFIVLNITGFISNQITLGLSPLQVPTGVGAGCAGQQCCCCRHFGDMCNILWLLRHPIWNWHVTFQRLRLFTYCHISCCSALQLSEFPLDAPMMHIN